MRAVALRGLVSRISESPRLASLLLAGLRLGKTGISLASMIVSARFFGVGIERDYLVVCLAATTVVPQLLFGPVNEIFRLKHAHLREAEGEEQALARANAVMSVAFWALLALTACVLARPGVVAAVFSPSFLGPGHREFLDMVRWMIPLLVLNQIAAGWTFILNAYKVYFIPEVVGIASSLLGIVVVVASTRWLGIYSLVLSMYVGAFLLLATLVPMVRRKAPGAFSFWRCDVRLVLPFFAMALPFYMSFTLGQGLVVVEKRIVGAMGVGMISILDYAQKIVNIPLAVLVSTIGSILAPSLASLHARNEPDRFREEFLSYLRLTLLALAPLIVFLAVAGLDLLSLVFGRKVAAADLATMASTLSWFSAGLVPVAVYSLAGQAITAMDRSRIYALAGAAVQIATIVLNLRFAPAGGVQVLALSWSAAHLTAAAFLLGRLHLGPAGAKALFQVAGVYATTVAAAMLTKLLLGHAPSLVRLPVSGVCVVAAAALSLVVLRLPERSILARAFHVIRARIAPWRPR